MNANEGLMRIAMVVRWAGYVGAGCIIVFAIAVTYKDAWEFGAVVGIIVAAALCAGCGWTLAWIIEGFAKPKG